MRLCYGIDECKHSNKKNGSFESEAHTKTLHELTYSEAHICFRCLSVHWYLCAKESRASDALPSKGKTRARIERYKTPQTNTRINVTKRRCMIEKGAKKRKRILYVTVHRSGCACFLLRTMLFTVIYRCGHIRKRSAANRNYKSTENIQLKKKCRRAAVWLLPLSLRNVCLRSEAFTCLTFQPFLRLIEIQPECWV